MNQPYVKQYNKNGELTNPIIGAYLHNSSSNRGNNKKSRFRGNNKGVNLTVLKTCRYFRHIQHEIDIETGLPNQIEHYILAK